MTPGREVRDVLTEQDREALADACDAGIDFERAWIRFIRHGDESMLLPVVERIVARHIAEAEQETARLREGIAALADEWEHRYDSGDHMLGTPDGTGYYDLLAGELRALLDSPARGVGGGV